jgi:hypothetical protein
VDGREKAAERNKIKSKSNAHPIGGSMQSFHSGKAPVEV